MELSSAADTTNLYRPTQVEEARGELDRMSAILDAPPHVRGKVSDVRLMQQRRKRLQADLEKFTPKAFKDEERDAAVSEFKTLAEQISAGMPSSEVMRRNPPGAVSQHMGWERRNKAKIARYKHLGLRLAAGGDVHGDLAQSADVVNIEMLRDHRTSHDLAMDGAQIPKKTDFHFGADPVNAVVFSDAEEAALTDLAPDLAGRLALLGNDERAKIKAILAGASAAPAAVETVKPKLEDMNFQSLQQLAKKNGMNTYAQSKAAVTTWLRARHLIQ